MEVLKIAFDTLIIGAVALPWVAVLLQMSFLAQNEKTNGQLPWVSALPKHARDAVLSVVILALGYFLGAAVARVSDDFFGDDDIWSLPNEVSIRKDVYHHEYCDVKAGVLAAMALPSELVASRASFCESAESNQQLIDTMTQFFRLEEGKLLLQGDDRTTRLRELNDQIVILRGACMNFMILSTLCLFGFCASFRSGSRNLLSLALTLSPAALLILYGGYHFYSHFHQLNLSNDIDLFRDPPLGETVMIIVGLAGLSARAPMQSRLNYARGCALSLAIAIMAYGAWWWTEVMYNESIIHAYSSLR
jgi:hypothetical protein